MNKSKAEFITDLLNTKALNEQKKEKIYSLAAKEFGGSMEEIDKIWKEIEKLKGTKKKNLLIHNPKAISAFLNNFKLNTALKFCTHIWDPTDFLSSTAAFYEKLNKEKEEYNFSNLFNYNRQLYNLLNYFLFIPNQEVVNGVPLFGWPGNLNDLKIGWQFPEKLLRNWSEANFDIPDEINRKKPFQFPIPEALRPKKRIKNIEIANFEDVVNIFKTEIQFRGDENNLLNNAKFLLKKYNLQSSNLEILDKLDFYTYTKGVINAIDKIFSTFQKLNESKKNVDFEIIHESNYLIICITQIDSFPAKKLNINEPNQFFSGDSIAIASHLFSLCDYSIISKFNNEDFIEIEILKDETEAEPDGQNIKKILSNYAVRGVDPKRVNGFTHKLKFYI